MKGREPGVPMDYKALNKKLFSLIRGTATVSALANTAALLYDELDDVSWTGFYILKGDTLILDYPWRMVLVE